MDTFIHIVKTSLYLLALLNPASKVMFLASYAPPLSRRQNFELTWRSSVAAGVILLLVAGVGQFVLSELFRVELCSLQMAGGAVVLVIGWRAIQEGHFVRTTPGDGATNYTDISLVPLAAPLIAGPGMIAAVVSVGMKDGFVLTSCALLLAILTNFVIMLFSQIINRIFTRTHLLGPVIRMTGLVIVAISVQMILTGVRSAFAFVK